MGRTMRRKEREITDLATILKTFESLPIGHLAMNDGERPYGVTMNYFAEVKDGKVTLYFHGAKTGRKSEILAKNPSVYFFAERDDGPLEITRPDGIRNMTELYISVAGDGNMEQVIDLVEKERILLTLANKYAKHPFVSLPEVLLSMTVVWKLVLKNFTGKSNPPIQNQPS